MSPEQRVPARGSNMVGKFNMNLSDKTKPTITFKDCYAMHNTGFDAVCSNYTQDIQIRVDSLPPSVGNKTYQFRG